MQRITCHSALPVLFLSAALTACGGGGGGGPAVTSPPPAPTTTNPPVETGVQGVGILSKFGAGFSSVTVNGSRFDTSGAGLAVVIDDQPATLDQLSLGDVVTVIAASSDNGATAAATRIVRDDNLEGPIAAGSIDLAAQTLVVLGQTVQVTPVTLFDDSIAPRSLDGLAGGEAIEVSGLPDSNGVIVATRIERQNGAGPFEVHGIVSAHDAARLRFNLGALVVDYSAASVRDFASGAPSDGDRVEVKGSAFGTNGELLAIDVESKTPAFAGDDGDLAEIEGFVTRFVSAADFDVAGRPVTTTGQTEYERGTASDLQLNAHLEAEGTVNGSGVLIARKIEFKVAGDNPQVRIEASVDTVDASADTFTVLGLNVIVDSATLAEDNSDAELTPFGLAGLNPGDYVALRGYEDPTGSQQVRALRLERENADEDTILQGTIESVARPMLTVLGIMVNTSGATRFENANGQALSADAFFAAVAAGRTIKAKGLFNGSALEAEEVEFEN